MAAHGNIFESKRREIYWQLKEIGLEEQECHAEATLILEQISGVKQAQQFISDLNEFPYHWQQEIARIINLRRERRPLAYCLGEIEFAGLPYKIIPGVLIPRPDTETLIEAVIEWAQNNGLTTSNLHIAEIGTGSGIIAVNLLKRLPNCTVWACDISQAAIATALGNARRHDVHNRLTLVRGDWRKILPNDFDVIVSNPPYIPNALSDADKSLQPEIYFEPQEALFAGVDGLDFYREFAALLPKHYKKSDKGKSDKEKNETKLLGAFEIGDKQEESVLSIFQNHGWQNLEIKNDIHGLPRVITIYPPV